MMFFRASPLKKEEGVDNCASLQVLGGPTCAALSRSTQHSVQNLSIQGLPCFSHLTCQGFLYKKTPLFITSNVKQRACLQENFLLFQIKTRTHRWHNCRCELPADACSRLLLSLCIPQHNAECEVQHKVSLDLLRLTVTGIPSSLVYNGLQVRIQLLLYGSLKKKCPVWCLLLNLQKFGLRG